MASATFKVDYWSPLIPVNYFNVKTNQPVVIQAKIDTGANDSYLNSKHASQLGINNVESGEEYISTGFGGAKTTVYGHKLKLQIGALKPITTEVVFSANQHHNLLGRVGVLSQYILDITDTSATITEYPPNVKKANTIVRRYNNIVLPG